MAVSFISVVKGIVGDVPKSARIAKRGIRGALLAVAVCLSMQMCACACQGPADVLGGGLGDTLDMTTGQDYAIGTDILGTDYTWTSDDEGIAVVNDNGEIVAVSPGETYITIKSGDKECRIKVVVSEDVATPAKSNAASNQESASGASASSAAAATPKSDSSAIEKEQRDAAIDKVPVRNVVTLYGADVKAKPGDTGVKLLLFVDRNPGILGMTLAVHYDMSALTLVRAENGSAVKDVLTLTKPKVFEDGCKFVWDGVDIEEYQALDGSILALTFDVAQDAKQGVYHVDFTYGDGDIVNAKLVPVDADIIGGTVTVE